MASKHWQREYFICAGTEFFFSSPKRPVRLSTHQVSCSLNSEGTLAVGQSSPDVRLNTHLQLDNVHSVPYNMFLTLTSTSLHTVFFLHVTAVNHHVQAVTAKISMIQEPNESSLYVTKIRSYNTIRAC